MKIKGFREIWKKYNVHVIAALFGFSLTLVFGGVFAWKSFQKKAELPEQKREVKAAEKTSENQNDAVLEDKTKTQVAPPGQEAPKEQPAPQTTPSGMPTPQPALSASKPLATTTPKASTTTPAPTTAPTGPVNGVYSGAAANEYVEGQILALVNAERRSKGLSVLSYNATLSRAADIRVAEESILSFVGTDHTRPNGTPWSTVLSQVGYTGYLAAGENVAWGYKSAFGLTAANLNGLANQLFTQWKNSPSHYAAMIKPEYNQTGIGVNIIIQNGRLYYFGEELFGRR